MSSHRNAKLRINNTIVLTRKTTSYLLDRNETTNRKHKNFGDENWVGI